MASEHEDDPPASTRWTVTFPVSSGRLSHCVLPVFGVASKNQSSIITLRRRFRASTHTKPSSSATLDYVPLTAETAGGHGTGTSKQHSLAIGRRDQSVPKSASPGPGLDELEQRLDVAQRGPSVSSRCEQEGAPQLPLRPDVQDDAIRDGDKTRIPLRAFDRESPIDSLPSVPHGKAKPIGREAPDATSKSSEGGRKHALRHVGLPAEADYDRDAPPAIPQKRKIRKADEYCRWYASSGAEVIEGSSPPQLHTDLELGTLYVHHTGSKPRGAVQVWMWDHGQDGSQGWQRVRLPDLPHHPTLTEYTLTFSSDGTPNWIGPTTAKRSRQLPRILP